MKPTVYVCVLLAGKRVLYEKEAPDRPKLLEDMCGIPVMHHVINAAQGIRRARVVGITAIISSRFEEVLRKSLAVFADVSIAVQEMHRGTADAVWRAIDQGAFPENGEADYLIVLMGDQPSITSHDLDDMISCFTGAQKKCRAGIMTFSADRRLKEFAKCGVVIRGKKGRFVDLKARIRIRRKVKKEECHAGPYIFEASWLRGLLTVLAKCRTEFPDHAPEFHLYDALLAASEDTGVHTCRSHHPRNFLGVDTIPALEEVRKRMARRHRSR